MDPSESLEVLNVSYGHSSARRRRRPNARAVDGEREREYVR